MSNIEKLPIGKIMANNSYELVQTGGGCTAYRYEYDNRDYVLITDDGGCGVEFTKDSDFIVGLYNASGEVLATWLVDTLSGALHAGQWFTIEWYDGKSNPSDKLIDKRSKKK